MLMVSMAQKRSLSEVLHSVVAGISRCLALTPFCFYAASLVGRVCPQRTVTDGPVHVGPPMTFNF